MSMQKDHRCITLKLVGDLRSTGFVGTIMVPGPADRPQAVTIGGDLRLPASPNLGLALDQLWQEAYPGLADGDRSTRITVHGVSRLFTHRDRCQVAQQNVITCLNTWLDCVGGRDLVVAIARVLRPGNRLWLWLQTDCPDLELLPWLAWEAWYRYDFGPVEVGLAGPSRSMLAEPRSPNPDIPKSAGVRILGILGDSTGIDVAADRQALEALPDLSVRSQILVEPGRASLGTILWDEPIDLLFFAGHSQSQGAQGWLYLRPDEAIALDDLCYGLRRAAENGLQIAIFNSCDGLALAHNLANLGVGYVIVMRANVPNQVAEIFAQDFFKIFARDGSFFAAFAEARQRLQHWETDFPCASWLPIVYRSIDHPPPTWQELALGSGPIAADSASPGLSGRANLAGSGLTDYSDLPTGQTSPSIPISRLSEPPPIAPRLNPAITTEPAQCNTSLGPLGPGSRPAISQPASRTTVNQLSSQPSAQPVSDHSSDHFNPNINLASDQAPPARGLWLLRQCLDRFPDTNTWLRVVSWAMILIGLLLLMSHLGLKLLATQLNTWGNQEQKRGQLQSAKELYRWAIRLNPSDGLPSYNLGWLRLSQGRACPIAEFEAAGQRGISEGYAMLARCRILAKDYLAAEAAIDLCLKTTSYPEVKASCLINRAWSLTHQGRWQEAEPFLVDAVGLAPAGTPFGQCLLARSLDRRGRSAEALTHWQEVLKIDRLFLAERNDCRREAAQRLGGTGLK